MLSFAAFSISGTSPIYVQLILFIKRGLVAGTIQNGEELPSRRTLAALLGINPNTIQKAYRLLEDEGLIRSQMGAASVITVDAAKLLEIRRGLLTQYAQDMGGAMKGMGLSRQEALALLDQIWDDV